MHKCIRIWHNFVAQAFVNLWPRTKHALDASRRDLRTCLALNLHLVRAGCIPLVSPHLQSTSIHQSTVITCTFAERALHYLRSLVVVVGTRQHDLEKRHAPQPSLGVRWSLSNRTLFTSTDASVFGSRIRATLVLFASRPADFTQTAAAAVSERCLRRCEVALSNWYLCIRFHFSEAC